MAIVYVQSAKGRVDNTGAVASTNSITTTAGNTLIGVGAFVTNAGALLTSFADNDGSANAFGQNAVQAATATITYVFSKANIIAKVGYIATLTVTVNAYMSLTVTEVSGLASAGGYDQKASAAGLTCTTPVLQSSSGQFALGVGTDAELGVDGLTLDVAWITDQNTESLNPGATGVNTVVGHRIINSGTAAQTLTITHGNGSNPTCLIVTYPVVPVVLPSVWIQGISNQKATLTVDVMNLEYTQPWSARVALRADANPGFSLIWSNAKNDGAFACWELFWDTRGVLIVRIIHDFNANQYIEVAGSTGIIDSHWRTVFVTYDGSGTAAGVKIYLNALLETLTVVKNTLGGLSIVSAGQQMFITNQLGAEPTSWLHGAMSGWMVWNVAKDQTFISANSALDVLPTADGNTILRIPFSEGTGTTAVDTSTNHFNAILTTSNMWIPAAGGSASKVEGIDGSDIKIFSITRTRNTPSFQASLRTRSR